MARLPQRSAKPLAPVSRTQQVAKLLATNTDALLASFLGLINVA